VLWFASDFVLWQVLWLGDALFCGVVALSYVVEVRLSFCFMTL